MAETAADQAVAVEKVMTATQGQPQSVVQEALAAIGKPGQKATDRLWTMFVGGLVAGLLASVGALIAAILDGKTATAPEDVLKVFTPLLTGLVGLFVKSPTQ
ncbi:MAG: hypothetical protein WAT66_13825 [Actinomycetota bacterium]